MKPSRRHMECFRLVYSSTYTLIYHCYIRFLLVYDQLQLCNGYSITCRLMTFKYEYNLSPLTPACFVSISFVVTSNETVFFLYFSLSLFVAICCTLIYLPLCRYCVVFLHVYTCCEFIVHSNWLVHTGIKDTH